MRNPNFGPALFSNRLTKGILIGSLGLLSLAIVESGNSQKPSASNTAVTSVNFGDGCSAELSAHHEIVLNGSEFNSTTGEVNMLRLDTALESAIPGEANCAEGQFNILIRDFNPDDTHGTSGLNIYNGHQNSSNNTVINVPNSFSS